MSSVSSSPVCAVDLPGATTHFFTVDVEEHFHAHALARWAPESSWDAQPSRVDRNTHRLLDLLAAHRATGTFFVLGWVARKHPGLVRAIAAAGHEVASHGFWHRRVDGQAPSAFRTDVRDARRLLEDLSGGRVLGYRAPSFSINGASAWAFDVLLEEGYAYDSSRFPIRRPGYGSPSAPAVPHWIRCGSGQLLELPLATLSIGKMRLPGAGGAWLRHLPAALTTGALRQHGAAGRSGVFYIHPWDFDEAQPRHSVTPIVRWRHYGGLHRTWSRLEELFREFRFSAVAPALARIGGTAE